MIAMRPIIAAFLLAAAALVGGCGEDKMAGDRPVDIERAIEAREDNIVELNEMRYRIVMFRQINPRLRGCRATERSTKDRSPKKASASSPPSCESATQETSARCRRTT